MDVERPKSRDVQKGLGQHVPIRSCHAQVGLLVSQLPQEVLLHTACVRCRQQTCIHAAFQHMTGPCPGKAWTSRALTGLSSLLLSSPLARAACATGEGCGTLRLPLGRSGCVTTAATWPHDDDDEHAGPCARASDQRTQICATQRISPQSWHQAAQQL